MTVRHGVVSTIIPVFNRAGLLIEAVNSVLAQTYSLNEVIIVDDGSTDETGDVAQAFAARHPDVVRYLRLARGREWRARNHGVAAATGEFIEFLDSDDLLAPEKHASQVHALRAHPECGISYCYVREYAIGDPPPQRPARRTGDTFAQLFPQILSGRIWPYPSPLFRRSVIEAAGPFLEMAAYPDWELECRMGAMGVRLHHCRSFLAETRNTHRLEGRRRNVIPAETMRDSAAIHERILGHARRAGVPTPALRNFARRLFVVGRQCASIGLEPEARRSLDLAREIASAGWRCWIGWYAAISNRLGWQFVGRHAERVARGLWRVSHVWSTFSQRWRHRAAVAADEVVGRPVLAWPRHLLALWRSRPSRRLQRRQTRT